MSAHLFVASGTRLKKCTFCPCLPGRQCVHVYHEGLGMQAELVRMCVCARSILFMLRLGTDGQPHTYQPLGHQRLLVGLAANEL